MAKIVVFGATGYTGRLVSQALLGNGAAPVLAGRNADALAKMSAEIGGTETAVADVSDPVSVRRLLDRGDVLISTVGPFLRWGRPALDAAIAAGAHYFDSTGEGPFIRTVFEQDAAARRAEVALLSAFGFDYVPGNLAAGLALAKAPEAVRVEVGYFMESPSTSGGTQASMAGMFFERGFALRDGRIVDERTASRIRTFEVAGRELSGVSIPASEHFALPQIAPGLRDVDVFLGIPPKAARGLSLGSSVAELIGKVGPVEQGLKALTAKLVKGSTGGPSAAVRARSQATVVAEAFAADGVRLTSVTLTGGDAYDFTAGILAWGAQQALAGNLRDIGALGPVTALGLEPLSAAATSLGWRETTG